MTTKTTDTTMTTQTTNAHTSDKCRMATGNVSHDLCGACKGKTEWVAVLHGQNGTVKIAYRSPRALATGLAEQTKEGWMVASVYERVRQRCLDE